MKIISNIKANSLIQLLFLIFLASVMLFNRSFIGLYIFGLRVGEILTAGGFVIAIIFLLLPKNYLKEIDKATLLFAISKSYEDQKNYENSFKFFKKANDIQKKIHKK